GNASALLDLENLDVRKINDFDLEGVRYDAVVADFDSLNDDIERFLTQCALNRIAVYDARNVFESFTGRVKINRMSENNIGSLLPTSTYERTKLIIDWIVVLI